MFSYNFYIAIDRNFVAMLWRYKY